MNGQFLHFVAKIEKILFSMEPDSLGSRFYKLIMLKPFLVQNPVSPQC